ncbi:MAG TPA: hypothetical protein VGO94_04005 [Mycobacteriales bacterium]|jgi:hypothetical protein|nr:hypothetical protein [Cryptosporangiaceae bacterium]HEV7755003.1 hypothetical protein [Mycobacteriales bacterium]
MIRRERVAEELGRRWLLGELPAVDYFRTVRREAREQAERIVTGRLRRAAAGDAGD